MVFVYTQHSITIDDASTLQYTTVYDTMGYNGIQWDIRQKPYTKDNKRLQKMYKSKTTKDIKRLHKTKEDIINHNRLMHIDF